MSRKSVMLARKRAEDEQILRLWQGALVEIAVLTKQVGDRDDIIYHLRRDCVCKK